MQGHTMTYEVYSNDEINAKIESWIARNNLPPETAQSLRDLLEQVLNAAFADGMDANPGWR
jgi:hypothetical protein